MKKTIVLGVCGGIAAFKAAQLTSDLIKAGYDVEVIMTENAITSPWPRRQTCSSWFRPVPT